MVRAALEGVAYTGCIPCRHYEREHGLPIGRIMLVGGGTKNPIWMQAIADVCGREVSVAKVTVGACFGDAIMAALAGGAYTSWDELALSPWRCANNRARYDCPRAICVASSYL